MYFVLYLIENVIFFFLNNMYFVLSGFYLGFIFGKIGMYFLLWAFLNLVRCIFCFVWVL